MPGGRARLRFLRKRPGLQPGKAVRRTLKRRSRAAPAVAPAAVAAAASASSSSASQSSHPWLLVAGSVGTGKTTLARRTVEALQASGSAGDITWRHIEVSRFIRERKLYKEWDDDLNASIYDERMLRRAIKKELRGGGAVVDFHSVADLHSDGPPLAVVVLRADTSSIFDRLQGRDYPQHKISENVECEIFGTVREEVEEVFGRTGVSIQELQSDTEAQLKANIETLVALARGAASSKRPATAGMSE